MAANAYLLDHDPRDVTAAEERAADLADAHDEMRQEARAEFVKLVAQGRPDLFPELDEIICDDMDLCLRLEAFLARCTDPQLMAIKMDAAEQWVDSNQDALDAYAGVTK